MVNCIHPVSKLFAESIVGDCLGQKWAKLDIVLLNGTITIV
jgi:hypothetical protein